MMTPPPQPTADTLKARLAVLKTQLDNLTSQNDSIDNSIELVQQVQSRIANTQTQLEKLKSS